MKISTEIWSSANIFGEERAIYELAKAGFDAWDFSMFEMARIDWSTYKVMPSTHPLSGNDYVAFAKKLRKIGEDNGIYCNQSHAPFPSLVPGIRDLLKRAIECTAIAGGEHCIIHPDNHRSAEENAEMYFELLPFAKECGVKIATENMWNWDGNNNHATPAACSHHDDFLAHIKAVNDPNFVACLDIGHAEMKGLDTSAKQMILTLGDKLEALHIHDNDKWHDSHRIPFSMDINWEEVVGALKQINYKGVFTLEADAHIRTTAKTEEEALREIANLQKAARRLADMFERA
ncbi:MAG: sugar phosphate isomerase/epimerase [Clostridia bacterium]|nr:sugar phosphate isomerase/epimerase [Clostridia bacterium]